MAITLDDRRRTDRSIIRLFLIFVGVSVAVTGVSSFSTPPLTGWELLSVFFAGLALAFFVAGIPSFRRYRSTSILSNRQVLVWVAKGTVILSIVVTIFTIVIFEYAPELTGPAPFTGVGQEVLFFLVVMIALLFAFFLALLGAGIIAFGIIGVMSALEREFVPRLLHEIAESGKKEKLTARYRALRWLFNIPDVLKVDSLTVHPAPKRNSVHLRDVVSAMSWQLIFGAVLAMYVSLNPFVSGGNEGSLANIFGLLTNGALLIPVVIIPWLVYRSLGASIGGPAKEFTLYNGLRSRLFQTFFAVGTLLLVARILVTSTNIEAFVAGFTSFMGSLLLISLICTFVFLNYFENDLVEDIAVEFRAIRSPRDAIPPAVPP